MRSRNKFEIRTSTDGAAPNFWYIPVSPYPPYTVCVGDKLSFMYGVAHNVWLMTDGPDCDYPFTSPGFFLADATYGGGGVGGLANNYEVVVKAAGTLHIACQAGAHCANGQKVTITVEEGDCTRVVPDDKPTPPPPPPPSLVLAAAASLAVWTSVCDAGEVQEIRSAE